MPATIMHSPPPRSRAPRAPASAIMAVTTLAMMVGISSAHMVVLGKYEKDITVRDDSGMAEEIFGSKLKVEIVAVGFRWTEGPVWHEKERVLYFTDTIRDAIYKFDPKTKTVTDFLLNAGGLLDDDERKAQMVEPGPNGLVLDDDELIIMQHGARSVAKMDLELGFLVSLAQGFPDKEAGRFNSPNDGVIYHDPVRNGKKFLFFTDPPYGLINVSQPRDHDGLEARSEVNGSFVYAVDLEEPSNVSMICRPMMRPNGIDITPSGKSLFVSECCQGHNDSCSKGQAIWNRYHIHFNETSETKNYIEPIFNHASIFVNMSEDKRGCADGFKIVPHPREKHSSMLIASCPGGVCLVDTTPHKFMEPMLSHIRFKHARISNVAIGKDGYVYLTGEQKLWRIKLRKKFRKLFWEGRYSYLVANQKPLPEPDNEEVDHDRGFATENFVDTAILYEHENYRSPSLPPEKQDRQRDEL